MIDSVIALSRTGLTAVLCADGDTVFGPLFCATLGHECARALETETPIAACLPWGSHTPVAGAGALAAVVGAGDAVLVGLSEPTEAISAVAVKGTGRL